MAQPEFERPDFLDDETAEDIHERMMNNLPADIDKMPGGFPYDLTKPAALEIGEFKDYYLVSAIMAMFPQYAPDEWLDLHAQQVNLKRHEAAFATGTLLIQGVPGTEIEAGTIFCTSGTDKVDSIEFQTDEDAIIDDNGEVSVNITAVEAGTEGNVAANAIILQDEPDEDISSVTNPVSTTGGTEEESDDDLYDRIAAEYENSNTYVGNDNDYRRWAMEAGAGDCVVSSAPYGPGTVELILVDTEGNPASQALVDAVYNHIVSPDDRSKRLLPTACAQLTCVAATTIPINFTITGLTFDQTTSIEQIKEDFKKAIAAVFVEAKENNIVRYNDVRPIISDIVGVTDFETFLMNGDTANINLTDEEYPAVGTLSFS